MNIATLRMSYIQLVNARRVRDRAREQALELRTDAAWHEHGIRQSQFKDAKKDFKGKSKEFACMVAGDTELSKIIGKFLDDREATNKALLDAVRNKANVIIPGDKQ